MRRHSGVAKEVAPRSKQRTSQIQHPQPLHVSHVLFFVVPIALFILFFFPSFSPDVRFSYRDVAFYYYPLFQQIQHEWENGRVPLWTPFVNLGQPLAADPTASVFYPAKLVFFLSSLNCISYATCFKLYIWIHIVIAFILSYRLSRNLKISHIGSLFSAITYTFSGQVLFQYTNVIYLVGAAWAPVFFSLALSFYRETNLRLKRKILIKLSVLLALTILGGEPQIVYLTLIALAIIFIFVPTKLGSLSNICRRSPFVKVQFLQRFVMATVFIAIVSITVFCLAAIQILPSLEMIAGSQRADETKPRSIWEIPRICLSCDSFDQNDAFKGEVFSNLLCSDFSSGGQSCSNYRFSVGPWRWLEFIFPNIGGRQFPQSTRWFNVFPEEVSVWSPSLYFGVFPFLLAVSAFSFRYHPEKRNSFQTIGTWIVVVSLLASMGGFGLVWICRAIGGILSGRQIDASFSDYDPVGGVYWLLNVVLPYFSNFRYPAKLLTLAMLGFSCLAGFGWDRKSNSIFLGKTLIITDVVAFCCLILVTAIGKDLFSSIHMKDPLFGSFQPLLAQKEVCNSLLQTTVVLLISTTIYFLARHKTISRFSRFVQLLSFCLLAVTAVDVYLANNWTIVVSPSSLFNRESDYLKQIEKEQRDSLSIIQPKLLDRGMISREFCATPPVRVYRFPVWFPPIFQTESSRQRNAERVIWDVETLFPQYPFDHNIALLDVRGAVSEKHYNSFIDATLNSVNVGETLGFLDVRYAIGPKFWISNLLNLNLEPIIDLDEDVSAKLDCSVTMEHVQSPVARATLCRSGNKEGSLTLQHPDSQNITTLNSEKKEDYIEILSYEPNSIVYIASATRSSDIIFAEQFWPDWYATSIAVSPKQADNLRNKRFNATAIQTIVKQLENDSSTKSIVGPTERTLKFLRKTSIPKGLWCIKVDYRPKKLFEGVLVSLISWGALAFFSVYTLLKRKKYQSEI